MRKTFTLAVLLMLPLALAGQQPQTVPAIPASTTNNTALTGGIMERLISDPVLKNTTITIAITDNGTVTLNGDVTRQALADRAAAVVKSVAGVHSVQNMILVSQDPFAPPKPPLPSPMPPINSAAPAPMASNSTQARLAKALAAVAGLVRVGTRTYDNEVLLFGTVETEKAKKQATQIAQEVAPKMPIKNSIWVV
ncbi:MAG: BON domain-containing protein, partial [Terriglobales bacterium]